mgnify:CR=1 FL=1
MIVIFKNYFIFLLLAFFNGKIFLNYFLNDIKILNKFEQPIIGLIVTAFVAQLINFFLPLSDILIYLNILIIIIYLLFDFKKIHDLKSLSTYISVPIFFLVLASIYGSSFSDDLNHYHHGSILNLDANNYIVGSNSLHRMYGFSSLWLILHSYFNFDYSRLQDIHILNGLIFFLFLSFVSAEIIKEIQNKRETIYLPILIFSLLFVLIKYTRLKEFGIDRPAFLIFFYIVLFYIKHIALNFKDNTSDQFKISVFFLLSLISTFLVFTKIIFIFTIFFPLTIFLLIKKKNLIIKNPLFYIFGLIYISYFIKNFLISGCLVYPVESFCFSKISWYESETIRNLSFGAEVVNKSFHQYDGELADFQYIKNFNWVKTWYSRNYNELFDFLSLISLIFIITILNFKKSLATNTNKEKLHFFSLAIIFIFSFLLLFLKTPVIRMSHHVFYLLFVIFIMNYFRERVIIINKKAIFLLILLAFTINFSKNMIRIKKANYINDPIFILKKSGLYNMAVKNKIENFVYYKGWIGGSPIGNSKLDDYNYKKRFIFDIISKK